MDTREFYDQMSPFYHLLFWQGFDSSIQNHGRQLDGIIREQWGKDANHVLDVSCGIGTQALGLAELGYQVTASDLSTGAIERARHEAEIRGLTIDFTVADMRQAFEVHQQQFDVVLSADNSIPHLLSDEEISIAFRQFYQCCKPGGGCLISVRDYSAEERAAGEMMPYGTREGNGGRYFIFQVRDYDGDFYTVSMYFVEDDGISTPKTHVMRTKYYAVGIDRLMELLRQAGFDHVQRLDEVYFQPVVIGTRKK